MNPLNYAPAGAGARRSKKAKFSGETTFARDFPGHEISYEPEFKGHKYRKNPAKLGSTSYNCDYLGDAGDLAREMNAAPEGIGSGGAGGARAKVKF